MRIKNFGISGYAANYCFLIAVAKERIYEMILQLQEAGIKEYGVF